MHSTLKIKTNIILTLLWLAITLILFILLKPYPYILLIFGSGFGFVCGVLQYLSFNEAKNKLKEANTLIEVRNALKSTRYGKISIYALWFSNIMLVIITLLFSNNNPVIGIIVGYFSLMLIREIITLKPTFELSIRE